MKWGTIETELLVLPHASAAKNFCFWLHLFVSLVFSWLSNFENGSSASCIFRINTFYFAPNGVHYGCILLWYSSVQLDYLRIGRRRWRWNHSRDSFFFQIFGVSMSGAGVDVSGEIVHISAILSYSPIGCSNDILLWTGRYWGWRCRTSVFRSVNHAGEVWW